MAEPPPALPVSPPADGSPINWERLLQESLEYEQRRRRELDEYESKRKEEYESWEAARRAAMAGEEQRMRAASQEAEQRREAEHREAERRCEAAESKLRAELRELERQRVEVAEAAKELEARRKHLAEDQAFSASFVSRVASQQAAVAEEVQRENDELRRKIAEVTREVADLRGRQEGAPQLDDVLRRADRLEESLAEVAKASKDRAESEFVCSDRFALVLQWLHGLGLTRYAPRFAANEFDLDACAGLTEADLDAMGITAVGTRRRLLVEAAALGQKLAARPESGADAGVGGLTPRSVLELFYQKYDPAKVVQVPDIAREYDGDLGCVFATVAALYPISFPSPHRDRLAELLSATAPVLLPCCDVLLDLYEGREVELMGYIMRHAHGVGGAASPLRSGRAAPSAASPLPIASPPPVYRSPPRGPAGTPMPPPRPDDPPPEGFTVLTTHCDPAAAAARDALAQLLTAQGKSNAAEVADFVVAQLASSSPSPGRASRPF